MTRRDFNLIKALVETTYPFSISRVFYRCRSAKREDLGGRYKMLIELFEVFIKFLGIVQLQDAQLCFSSLKDRLPQKEKTLDFLKRPSLGGWVGLLRILSEFRESVSGDRLLSQIGDWYNQAPNAENTEILKLFSEIEEIQYQKNSKTPVAEICNAFVTLRNKLFGHGSMLHEKKIVQYIPLLETILAYLITSAEFLSRYRMFYVEKREMSDKEKWVMSVVEMAGINEENNVLTHSSKLEAREIYYSEIQAGQLVSEPIKLSPFVLWTYNEDIKQMELFFYNDSMRTKIEYVSYTSGSFYYHKELHSDLKKLIDLELALSKEEDKLGHLAPEERAERCEYKYKQAMLCFEHDKFEDALELLESAVEYQRRPELFIFIAKIQIEMGEPIESVAQTIQNALDMDPSSQAAHDLLLSLDNLKSSPLEGEEDAKESGVDFPTFVHVLTPKILRPYCSLYWFGLLLAWFAISLRLELAAGGNYENTLGALGIVIGSSVFIFGLPLVRIVVKGLRLPLSLQLAKMRLDRFNIWYDKQMIRLFGCYEFDQNSLNILPTLKGEKVYYLIFLVAFIGLEIKVNIAACSFQLTYWLLIKRFVDYGIIILLLIPCVRYVVMSTFFVLEYSKLSLKPLLSKINDDGLRAFGPFLGLNVMLATIANAAFFTGASFMHKGPIWGDFPILAIISLVVMFWSVGMPFTIFQAAKKAKLSSVHAYAEQLENAFNAFVQNPNDDTLTRYRWLKKNQAEIRQISCWPLTVIQTIIFVVFSNLVLITVNVWFVLKRTGMIPLVMNWVGN